MGSLGTFLLHLFPNAALLIAFTCAVAGEWLSHTKWWPKMPWGRILVFTFVFWAGYAYSEAINPDSGFRDWWRNTGATFEIVSAWGGHAGNPERIDIWCLVQLREDLDNPNLTIKVTTLGANDSKKTVTVEQRRLGELAKDTRLRIKLGEMPIPHPGWKPKNPSWGDGSEYSIIGQSKNLVTVSIGDFSRQIYVQVLDPDREDTRRLVILTEGEAPFAQFK